MERAAEYGAATERVDKALATLKSELMELRSQDVDLMKQLITINDTIRELTPKKDQKINRKNYFYLSKRGSSFGLHMLPENDNSSETSLVRQQSAPNFSINRRGSSSSIYSSTVSLSDIEDVSCSVEDCIFQIGTEVEEFMASTEERLEQDMCGLPRAKSFCIENRHIPTQDSCYEDILMNNVKLWKSSQIRNDTIMKEKKEEKLKCRCVNT